MIVIVNDQKFRLGLDAEGKPYTLKRWCQANGFGRWHWATVWASWHKHPPTGVRRQAIEQCGFSVPQPTQEAV